MSDLLDLYDSDVQKILEVTAELRQRASAKQHNFGDFEREIQDRFADIGFTVDVSWYSYGFEGTPGAVSGSAMPEITITGRVIPEAFDRDRQVSEATRNILQIPGADGVIKTDKDTLKRFLGDQGGNGHGHSHG